MRVTEVLGRLKDLSRETDVAQEGEEVNCWAALGFCWGTFCSCFVLVDQDA